MLLKPPENKKLNKQEFIEFLKNQEYTEASIYNVNALPDSVGEYSFLANVTIIPLSRTTNIINYVINYQNKNGDNLYKKMIYNNLKDVLKYANDMLIKYNHEA